ncbi:MAG: NAD-dependent epimerase/dehydratase family protein [Abyssibacter sp.]|nr:NAD-dependent epimerase/dehydratase family protein [Abyssibacter sp.]
MNLVQRLSPSRPVAVLDNLRRASPTGCQEEMAVLHQGDILNPEGLAEAFRDVEQVVHLAAYGSVVESVADPRANFAVNVQGTLNVLQASVDAGVRRLVFASTGGALIGDAVPPVNERSLPKPISPYGASKLCGEAYCHAFAKAYGLETVCLRFGNVYGPHSVHKKGAATTFMKALMTGEPIVIYGDGSASRDYVHVEDLCSGITAALDAKLAGGEVFHLASGQETTVLELAETLRTIAGKPDHPIEFRPARAGEVARNFATYDKARERLGFRPKWKLADGLAAAWEWFQQQDESVLTAVTTDS